MTNGMLNLSRRDQLSCSFVQISRRHAPYELQKHNIGLNIYYVWQVDKKNESVTLLAIE